MLSNIFKISILPNTTAGALITYMHLACSIGSSPRKMGGSKLCLWNHPRVLTFVMTSKNKNIQKTVAM